MELSPQIITIGGGLIIGLVIGLGCTFGQGITGVATLSMGSFLATFAIITGATLTVVFSPEEQVS